MSTKVSKNLITNIDPSQITTTGATDGQVLTLSGGTSKWATLSSDAPVSRFVTNYQQIYQLTRSDIGKWFSLKSKMRNPLNKTNPWDSFITKKFSRLFLAFFVTDTAVYITQGNRVYYDPAAAWQNVNSPMIADLGINNPNLTNHKYFYELVVTAGSEDHVDESRCIMKEVFLNDNDDVYVRIDDSYPFSSSFEAAGIFIAGII